MTLFKTFKLSDILFVQGTKSTDAGKLVFKDVGVNFVGRTNVNNGIQGMVDMLEYPPNEGGTISLSQVGTIVSIYQQEPYYTSQNIVKISSSLGISKPVGSYLTTVINKCLKQYVGYNTPKIEDISNLALLLPVKSLTDTEPDWEYMEQYIKEIEKKAILKVKEQNEKDIALLKEIVGQEKGTDFTEDVVFREFNLEDIFMIESTKPLDAGSVDFIKEGVNFVGRVGTNNGVQGKIEKQVFEPNAPNTITATVIGNIKYVKYQKDFYYTSQNINKLTPKVYMNENHILYFITHIKKFVEQYNGIQGGYKLADIKEHRINLPVNKRVSEQVPDWKFIEEYMKHIQQKYIKLKEQENEIEINNLLSVTGLTLELILSEEGQFA